MLADPRPPLAEFDYRPRPGLIVAVCGALAVCGVLVAAFATTIDGPVQAGFLQLSAKNARLLLYVISASTILTIASQIPLMRMALGPIRRIAVTRTSLLMPQPTWWGTSREEIEVPFADITGVEVQKVAPGCHALQFRVRGKPVVVWNYMMRTRLEFDALAKMLQAIDPGGPVDCG